MTGLLPLLLTVATWSGTVEHRTSFGSLTLIQERWTRDPGQPPMMHVPNSLEEASPALERPGRRHGDIAGR